VHACPGQIENCGCGDPRHMYDTAVIHDDSSALCE
jgi:hypothetical protein